MFLVRGCFFLALLLSLSKPGWCDPEPGDQSDQGGIIAPGVIIRPSFPPAIPPKEEKETGPEPQAPEKEEPVSPSQAFDFGSPPQARIQITPEFSIGARLGIEYTVEDNFNLDSTDPEDLRVLMPSLSMVFSYVPTNHLTFFANAEYSGQWVEDEEHKRQDKQELKLNQAFASLDLFDSSLRVNVGRQRIRDERQWVYDEELDSVRITYGFSNIGLDFSVGESNGKDVLHNDNEPEATFYMMYGRASLPWKTEAAIYNFIVDDHSSRHENLIFYGFELSGQPHKRFQYWAEFSHVRGRNAGVPIRGFGFDVGFTKAFKTKVRPSITVGFAFGSGDSNPNDNVDRNFRQSGLQDNNAAFNGVTRIQYYGEMANPELSNLWIGTFGVGLVPLKKKLSFDLVYHYYRQDQLARRFRDAEIDDRPNGRERDIGHELDLIAGYRDRRTGLTASFITGYFFPGRAFPKNADDGLYLEAKIRYDF